jgi:hypothetical protein
LYPFGCPSKWRGYSLENNKLIKKIKYNNMQQEHYDYLIELRDSGVTNMWGATPYLMKRFGMNEVEAGEILLEWIKSFKN